MSEDFFLRYEYKVKKLEDLKKILNQKSKNKKIILCHGHFDVVHPGHIRHLSYAKSKADILIVSLTADKYVSKGIYRPHVPEYLRALNIITSKRSIPRRAPPRPGRSLVFPRRCCLRWSRP